LTDWDLMALSVQEEATSYLRKVYLQFTKTEIDENVESVKCVGKNAKWNYYDK